MDLTDHPSQYKLVSQGRSIVLVQDERSIDLVTHPGHEVLATLEDIFEPFVTQRGRHVPSFTEPREHIRVREHRLGGWPTIRDTRIPYDTVAALVSDGSISPDQVVLYYPTVPPEAVEDAVDFAHEVAHAKGAA